MALNTTIRSIARTDVWSVVRAARPRRDDDTVIVSILQLLQ